MYQEWAKDTKFGDYEAQVAAQSFIEKGIRHGIDLFFFPPDDVKVLEQQVSHTPIPVFFRLLSSSFFPRISNLARGSSSKTRTAFISEIDIPFRTLAESTGARDPSSNAWEILKLCTPSLPQQESSFPLFPSLPAVLSSLPLSVATIPFLVSETFFFLFFE